MAAACWWLMFNTSVLLYPLWIIIIGGRLHGFGVILHDLTHMNFKEKPISWRFLEFFVGYPIGTTINAMAYHHLRHHRNTLMETDPYFNYNKKGTVLRRILLTFKKGPLFVPFWIVRSFVGSLAYYVPKMRTQYARIFLQDISKKDLTLHAEVETCCKEDRYQSIFHFFLLIAAFEYEQIFYMYYMANLFLCVYLIHV